MTTSHQRPGRDHRQQNRHSGTGDAFVAGGDIHITPPAPATPPPGKSTGKAVAISVALVCTAALGAFLSAHFGWGTARQDGNTAHGSQGAQGVSPPAGTGLSAGGDTAVQPTVSGSEATGAPATDTIRYRGPIRLASLDLDANPPTVQSSDAAYGGGFIVLYPQLNAQGATAFGTSGDLVHDTPALAPYTRTGTPVRKDCADLLRTQAVETLPVEGGSRLCVKTKNGRIAFLTAGKFTNGAFAGTAVVWDAIG
ncbi:hypothetical protein [Streptomyces sp. NPDC053048]|uniref:hypothetical protein n=1 Tax=Streptomyces sp. NPDC053048 TaxID=3365694 RepID=UPI0037D1311F